VSGSAQKPTAKELLSARDHFRALLASRTRERQWQRFFADNPFVLSSALPLRLEPGDVFPLGREGRTEPDFAFYPRHLTPIPYYGVIELKRPDSSIVTVTRSNVAILTRDAQTAVHQAQMYARNPSSFLPSDIGQRSLFLGNATYLFVIMGLTDELSRKLGNELYRESITGILPPNLQLLPYDYILQRFEDHVSPQIFFLVPLQVEAKRIPRTFSSLDEVVTYGSGPALFRVTVGGTTPTSVVLNYEYATREAAEDVQDYLTANGYQLIWNSSMIDGEDEEWECVSRGRGVRRCPPAALS
jgi:hypothetical protein